MQRDVRARTGGQVGPQTHLRQRPPSREHGFLQSQPQLVALQIHIQYCETVHQIIGKSYKSVEYNGINLIVKKN